MYQNTRGSRRKNSFAKQFSHSCLGQVIIVAVILLVIGIVAYITCPSENQMRAEMVDKVKQSIERDSIKTDWLDDAVHNLNSAFTQADSGMIDAKVAELFNMYNRMEYVNHTFFATMNIYNSFQVGGERCGIGFFGLVFPTVNFNKYIIHDGPLRGEYSKPITPVPVDTTNQEGAFGENPDLGGIFRYENE